MWRGVHLKKTWHSKFASAKIGKHVNFAAIFQAFIIIWHKIWLDISKEEGSKFLSITSFYFYNKKQALQKPSNIGNICRKFVMRHSARWCFDRPLLPEFSYFSKVAFHGCLPLSYSSNIPTSNQCQKCSEVLNIAPCDFKRSTKILLPNGGHDHSRREFWSMSNKLCYYSTTVTVHRQ